jgi:hypothetical protein
MILTSDRGFTEWGEVFSDPAVATTLPDRQLHHAVVGCETRQTGALHPASEAALIAARSGPLV